MATKVLGLNELKAKLEALPDRMAANVVGAGNRAVAIAMRKEVESQGGSLPSTVVWAITHRPNRMRQKTKGFLVGLRKPFSSMSHWFEFGTGERRHKSSGKSTGAMPATPYLRPALERLRPVAEQIWAKAASRNFALQLRKLAGR